jgi:hypothetical protein
MGVSDVSEATALPKPSMRAAYWCHKAAVAEGERDGLLAKVERLREVLEKIRDHRHCSYDRPDPVEAARNRREYDIGVTDGHRCAATIARVALKGEHDAGA